MERACCRRRPATTNKRGGLAWADEGRHHPDSGEGETDRPPQHQQGDHGEAASGSTAKRPRGSPELSAPLSGEEGEQDQFGRSVSGEQESHAVGGRSPEPAGATAAASSSSLGHAHGSAASLLFDGFRRKELVRLLLQAVSELGLTSTAEALEREAGVQLEPPEVRRFRLAVLAGDWATAATSAELLSDLGGAASGSASSDRSRREIRFLLARQRFLELLASTSASATEEARRCWREELASSAFDDESREWLMRAQTQLTSDFAGSSAAAMSTSTLGGGSVSSEDFAPGSREALVSRILALLPEHLVLPPHRLSVLLWQAVRYQELHCLHHSVGAGLAPPGSVSLLRDHTCEQPPLPTQCVARLSRHAEEVWCVAASHNGRLLASASRDCSIFVWSRGCQVASFEVICALEGHAKPCSHLAWSPDDRYLLTGSIDSTVLLWVPAEGKEAIQSFEKHWSPVTSVAWLPDSKRFITAGYDHRVCLCDVTGVELHRWELPGRVQDLAVLRSGTRAVVVDSDRNLKVIDVVSPRELPPLPEGDAVTSICASRLRDDVLVNIAHQVSSSQQAPVIRLWDVAARRVSQRYLGHSQGRFVVRSCFGGAGEEFVISGSEDANVYIWHRHFGSLLQVLSGHEATVNAACWVPSASVGVASSRGATHSPEAVPLLVSASDDYTLRVWGPSWLPPLENSVRRPEAPLDSDVAVEASRDSSAATAGQLSGSGAAAEPQRSTSAVSSGHDAASAAAAAAPASEDEAPEPEAEEAPLLSSMTSLHPAQVVAAAPSAEADAGSDGADTVGTGASTSDEEAFASQGAEVSRSGGDADSQGSGANDGDAESAGDTEEASGFAEEVEQ